MTKLQTITAAMQSYNRSVAYGSECNAWQDFHADCHAQLGHGPTDEWFADDDFHAAGDLDVSDDFAAYWLAVAEGRSEAYNPETGSDA